MQYQALQVEGHAANQDERFFDGQQCFDHMDLLAAEAGDMQRRLDALNPGAKAYWSVGDYDEAQTRLVTAKTLSHELSWDDEEGIAKSNLGRMAAHRVVQTLPFEDHVEALRDGAVPFFLQATISLRVTRIYIIATPTPNTVR